MRPCVHTHTRKDTQAHTEDKVRLRGPAVGQKREGFYKRRVYSGYSYTLRVGKGLDPVHTNSCWLAGNKESTGANVLCSFLLGLSPWTCLRGRYGDGWGRGMEDTSWVCSLYQ